MSILIILIRRMFFTYVYVREKIGPIWRVWSLAHIEKLNKITFKLRLEPVF